MRVVNGSNSQEASQVLTKPGLIARNVKPSSLRATTRSQLSAMIEKKTEDDVRAYLMAIISRDCFVAEYAGVNSKPASIVKVGSPIPEDKVITFLSEPFFSRGRKAFVVSMGPRTFVLNVCSKFSIKVAVSGLQHRQINDQRRDQVDGRKETYNSVIFKKAYLSSWNAPLLMRTSNEPPVILAVSSAAACGVS